MSTIDVILLRAFLNFLLLGSSVGLLVGAMLILRPDWLARVSLFTNRWVSTRHINRQLESTVAFDPWFYRYNRLSGSMIFLGALYICYFFSAQLNKEGAILGLSKHFRVPPQFVATWFDPLVLIALLGATFAMVISLYVYFRPSLLRDFEQAANQWVSLRSALKPLEIPRNEVDELAFRHARHVGVALIFGSVYTLVLLTLWAR